jgi:hypothetical protein
MIARNSAMPSPFSEDDTTISDIDSSEEGTDLGPDSTDLGPDMDGGITEPENDKTRLDLSPAPQRDPDTIIEGDPDATNTEVSVVSPDLTLVDRKAAPEFHAGADNTILDSATLETIIPESTMSEPMPRGLDAIDDLTIVPTDNNE